MCFSVSLSQENVTFETKQKPFLTTNLTKEQTKRKEKSADEI